ncbi:DNA replication and repair protein RecF [Desulfotomaculum arcticum]|uniref:DNA replication and repair protein RecF n=1 Tax=Desulfotruncus arcticus DSM 17038 TaxID=1121424 RepID=A0A1I2VN65_9FIRM|nr:DNA replication/repair protein RecF [Desulfotruncus arcticus]SFG90580.1 DNA replication and repair protein RecF [Desulfotomaculum arcticum] [Desulfotruncus arcticus DSM 17038]
MFLKELILKDFRNYLELNFNPDQGINIITGPNAQGKTNLLEAIFLSGMGFSFRLKDKDVVKWGNEHSILKSSYQLSDFTVDVFTQIKLDGLKKILINGSENNRKSLPGYYGIILFRPDDLQIIKGPPSQRRDFIDNDIGFISSVYRKLLKQYRRIVLHRNNLLRRGEHHKDDFKIWNEEFYRYGAEVLFRRIQLLKKYFPLARDIYGSIAGKNEKLDMKYLSSARISDSLSVDQIINDFIIEGKSREKEELYKKQTLFGPHRDDITFLLNNKDIRNFGSQGQIRSVVLALKAAQMKLFKCETGQNPIMLLDDVLMELDENRQNYLLKLISNNQAFITTTGFSKTISRHIDRVYFINSGTIKEREYTSSGNAPNE